MTKSPAEQLADLEDAEARLRPLVVEARQAIQDLRRVEKEVHSAIESWQERALKIANEPVEQQVHDHIQRVVGEKLEQFATELGKKQHALYKQVENAFDQLSAVFMGVDDERGDLLTLVTRLREKKRKGMIGKDELS